MQVAFRVDVSGQIGIGHFIRCLTLANALNQRGAKTRFVCRQLPNALRALLTPAKHEVVLLECPAALEPVDELAHAHFLGTSQRQDADATLVALSDASWDWVVVDHYAIDVRWESAVRQAARKVLVIDDVADRAHDCDILVDQNLYPNMARRYIGKTPPRCRVLLGPRYALLRDEFRHMRAKVNPRTGPIKRVLVFLGGMDPYNLTSRAIKALHNIGNGSLQVDVVIGAEHSHKSEIESACATYGYDYHVQTPHIAALMAAADLAIGAGGSASWERCCLGLASIALAFADNQFHIAHALDQAGACLFLGDQASATQEEMERALVALAEDNDRLAAMSRNAYALVDGRGVERVHKAMGTG